MSVCVLVGVVARGRERGKRGGRGGSSRPTHVPKRLRYDEAPERVFVNRFSCVGISELVVLNFSPKLASELEDASLRPIIRRYFPWLFI